ncbi:putative defensin-like protein 66 [Centruroides sculpturatus]|uniref:putative defensin-like protein 66 n=1 Tax=Centruroides sculpturatus TaxID=218467 RepID=UPI000C6DC6C3|nr:putative defensin-like protein 66 [Centruroides sculpturatus]
MLAYAAILILLTASVSGESFPYRPAAHLRNCTEKFGIDDCRAGCIGLKYKWGTCIMYPKGDGLWHPLCSCFTKTMGKLEIDNDYDDLLE